MSQPILTGSLAKETRAGVALLVTLFFVFLVLPTLALVGAPLVACFGVVGLIAIGALATLVLST